MARPRPAVWRDPGRARPVTHPNVARLSTVRAATELDAPAVEAVWAVVAAEGEWIGTELPLRPNWQDAFRRAVSSDSETWFVCEADGAVVGAIFVQDERGLGHVGMAILGEYRGRGLGRLLLTSAIEWAKSRECHKVALEMWPHNERARRLYASVGFAEEGRLIRHYRRNNGALWDAVVMGLVLDSTSPGRP